VKEIQNSELAALVGKQTNFFFQHSKELPSCSREVKGSVVRSSERATIRWIVTLECKENTSVMLIEQNVKDGFDPQKDKYARYLNQALSLADAFVERR